MKEKTCQLDELCWLVLRSLVSQRLVLLTRRKKGKIMLTVCLLSAVWPQTPTTQATLYQRPDCSFPTRRSSDLRKNHASCVLVICCLTRVINSKIIEDEAIYNFWQFLVEAFHSSCWSYFNNKLLPSYSKICKKATIYYQSKFLAVL